MATEVIAMVAENDVAVDASVEGRAAAAKKRLRVLAASFRMLSTLIAKVKSKPDATPRSQPQQAQPQVSVVTPKRPGPPRSFFCASAPAMDYTVSPHMRIGGGAQLGPSSNGGTASGEHRARALSGQPDGPLASCRVHGASDSALPELDASASDCFATQLTASSPDPLMRCHTLSPEAPSTPLSYLHCSGSLYPAPHAALSYPGQPADLAPPTRGAAAASRSPPASGSPAAQQPQAHPRAVQPYCLPSPDSPRPPASRQQQQQHGPSAVAAAGGGGGGHSSGGGWRQALSFARGSRKFRLHRQQQQQQASFLPCSQSADLDATRGRGAAVGGRPLQLETPTQSPRVAGGPPSDWPFPLSAASPVAAAAAAPRVVLEPYSASASASPTARLAAATPSTAPSLSLSAQLQQWHTQRHQQQQQQAPGGTPGEPATLHDGTGAPSTGKQVNGAGPAGAPRSLHVRPAVLADANTHASMQQQQHHHLATPLNSVLEHQASGSDPVLLDPASLKVCPAASASASAPAPAPGGRLLRLSPSLPAAMRRARWDLEEDYAISRRLYKGATSSVYKATCLHSGIRVALKVYFLSKVPETVLHMLHREVSIHAAVSATRSPHVLHLYAAFETDRHLVLVQEYAALGDLYRAVQHMAGADGAAGHYAHAPPRLAEGVLGGRVLLPLCRALALLHGRGIVHRDVKPENLLLCRPEDCPAEDVAGGRTSGGSGGGGSGGWLCKLGDFGVSVDLNRERAVTRAGTVCYMAPEVERCPLKYFPDDNKDNPSLAYTTAADIWSVGILAYELLVGVPPLLPTAAPPPSLPHHASHHHRHAPERAVLSFPASVSSVARDLITWALSPRPEDRPTALQLLQHPWLAAAARQQDLAAGGGV